MMALDGKAEAAQFCYDKYQVHCADHGIITSCIFPLSNGTLTAIVLCVHRILHCVCVGN